MSRESHRRGPNLSHVFASIDAHRQQFLDRLIDYVRHPSISAYGEGIDVEEVKRSLDLGRLDEPRAPLL